jgi:ribose 1,5-bisphosphokinase
MQAGTLIVVVGPSGAGKDSLINFVRQQLTDHPDIGFVRRVITRAAHENSEDHDSVDDRQFDALDASGAFAVSWAAHGLRYGIPAGTLASLAEGRTLIVNGSRSAIPLFVKTYPRLAILEITATPDVLAHRLAARGRETEAEIRLRLSRQTRPLEKATNIYTIDNSGELAIAGEIFLNRVLALSGTTSAAAGFEKTATS